MIRLVVVIGLLPLFMTPWTVVAGPFEDGVAAYERGDYARAAQLWAPLAEQGDPAAQFNIGLMFDTGRGVREDDETAVKWYRLAAEQGYAKAQFSLGTMYDRGEGVPQDFPEAAKRFRQAADQRNAKARYRLAYLYEKGRGVVKDSKEATRLYMQAAEQGLTDAQLRLGTLYALGENMPQDYVQAHMWFNLAVAGSLSGEVHDKALRNRDLVEKKMTTIQVTRAQKLFREWRPKVSP
jgi:TPR repeat protein